MRTASEVLQNNAVAIVGTGLVGRGWAVVFARAGVKVRLYDSNPEVLKAAPELISTQLDGLARHGLVSEPKETVLARINSCDSLEEAIDGAIYVQESILERVELKRGLMERLQDQDDGRRIIGSSTSGIPASRFSSGLSIASRVIIVHPVNPPSMVPLVELVPSPDTSAHTIEFARELMAAVRQSAITVNKEVEGFILNRLQAVLLREAWALVEDGIASVEDIDRTVRDGLGWRWAFMGPFETIDLNAVGGVADYALRLGPLYQRIAASRVHEAPWGHELIANVEQQRRSKLPLDQLAQRCQWRDLQLMAFAQARGKLDPANEVPSSWTNAISAIDTRGDVNFEDPFSRTRDAPENRPSMEGIQANGDRISNKSM